jgi:uncharacterized protein YqcC (DUF446 family)
LAVVPESERSLTRLLIGLEPRAKNSPTCPQVSRQGLDPAEVSALDEHLYWVDLELVHGGLLRSLPAETLLLVAVSDPHEVKDDLGHEREYFEDWLRQRLGWSRSRIAQRVRFGVSPAELEWSQDFSLALGYDGKGRLVLAQGSEGDVPGYRRAVPAMAKVFPQDFSIWPLPKGISAEGGDMSIATLSQGDPCLIIGRHRVLEYLRRTDQAWPRAEGPSHEQIEQARQAYSQAYAGLPVIIVPEQALHEPEAVSEELFHLDMLMASSWINGKAWAFVPRLEPQAVDANSRGPLPADMQEKVAYEMDLAAAQMKSLGYHVARMPLLDHPVRSPANMLRFRDHQGQAACMLPVFPAHLPAGDPAALQNRIQDALARNRQTLMAWQAAPGLASFRAAEASIRDCLDLLSHSLEASNHEADGQIQALRASAIRVQTVPCFVWGAGSLHCQTFH